MLVNISMKFHEDSLNGLKVIQRTQFCHRNCYLQSSKGRNSNNISKSYGSCTLHGRSSMRISGTVFKLQSGHDFVTDRHTDRQTDGQVTMAKTICLPTLKWGDIQLSLQTLNLVFTTRPYT